MLIPFKDLFARHRIRTSGVLHLGANLGQEAADYAAQGITDVVWVEAIPEIHANLERNVVRNYQGSVALLACLSDVDGQKVSFNIASNQGQSSSFLEFGTHAVEHPTVKYVSKREMTTVRVDTLLAQHNIKLGNGWFLNVDLQGAELLALKGMGDLLRHFDYAYIEVNVKPLYVGCPLVKEIDSYLAGFGLVGRETKMTGSGWGDKFYSKQ